MNQAFESIVRYDTKDRILDAAERLFAEHGFAATSLRQITTEAAVNLAAVNYHFKSKEALLSSVIERTLLPINLRRLELLDEIEARSKRGKPDLEAVVRAFVRPAFEAWASKSKSMVHFPRLMARVMAEPDEWVAPVMLPAIKAISDRFVPVFQKALGVKDPTTVLWCVQFSVGCLTRCLSAPEFIRKITGVKLPDETMEQVLNRAVSFIVGGMQALVEREKSL